MYLIEKGKKRPVCAGRCGAVGRVGVTREWVCSACHRRLLANALRRLRRGLMPAVPASIEAEARKIRRREWREMLLGLRKVESA